MARHSGVDHVPPMWLCEVRARERHANCPEEKQTTVTAHTNTHVHTHTHTHTHKHAHTQLEATGVAVFFSVFLLKNDLIVNDV